MRIGIIGAGTIGKAHAEAARAAGVDIAWIVDKDANRATELALQCSQAQPTQDVEQFLADESTGAAVVATPNRWHKDLAIAALEAGKDVLLEKPMGLCRAECEAINCIAERTGRILQIGMANRFSAVGQAAKEIVASGALGDVYHGKANLILRRGIPGLGGWFTTHAVSGGGVLIDNGVHLVDMLLWLLDFPPVKRVSGRTYRGFGSPISNYAFETMWAGPPRLDGVCDVEESAHALIHFGDEGTLELSVAWAINAPQAMVGSLAGLFGRDGGLTFEFFGDSLNLASQQFGRLVDSRIRVKPTDAFREQMASFVRCVETRQSPLATGSQAQAVQSVLDAVYESHRLHREVVLGD